MFIYKTVLYTHTNTLKYYAYEMLKIILNHKQYIWANVYFAT
jgi:hypothetical protein